MNHQTITANLIAIIFSIFLFLPILEVCALGFESTTYYRSSSANQWTVLDTIEGHDSFYLYELLKLDGYVAESVSFGEFDYICVLTQQLCTMTKEVTPNLALAVIAVESNFDTSLVNSSARGLMQLIPLYHSKRMSAFVEKDHLIDLDDFHNPRLNIATGLDYLDYILKETNRDTTYALMWYNQGPTSASKDYIDQRKISTYARKVLELAEEIKPYV